MPIALGALIAGGSVLGAGINAIGANSAASTSAAGYKAAANVSQNEYNDIANKLLPFLTAGQSANTTLAADYAPGGAYSGPISSIVGAPPSPNDASLKTSFQASPGYNYLLQQGADSVQNSAAGRTGAVSGNMLKGLQTNATGLASQDWSNYYQQLVDNYNSRYTDAANNRTGTTSALEYLQTAGQNAGAQVATSGTALAGTTGKALSDSANATATGTTATTSALTSPLNNSSNYNALLQLLGYGSSPSNPANYGGGSTGSSNLGI